MSQVFTTQRRVEFRDTDAAGIAHFSMYGVYMEQAEHELWRSLDSSVLQHSGQEKYSWPRVSLSCDYRSSVKFEDILDIEVRVAHVGTKSIRYEFRFECNARLVAEGAMVAVYCQVEPNGRLTSEPIPEHIRQMLSTFH